MPVRTKTDRRVAQSYSLVKKKSLNNFVTNCIEEPQLVLDRSVCVCRENWIFWETSFELGTEVLEKDSDFGMTLK